MFIFASEPDVDLLTNFANDAAQSVHVGDESWLPYAQELVRLYELREEHTHEWWLTPRGSVERADYEVFNARYTEALHKWGYALRVLRINHAEGKFFDFETIYTACELREMERQFS